MKRKLAELKAILTADKKQATILAGLMVFLLISAGRMLLSMGPSGARASTGIKAGKPTDQSENPEIAPATGKEVLLAPLSETTRDMFALDPEKFPRPAPSEQTADVEPKSEQALAEASGVAVLSERELIETRVHTEAASLRLRSTLLGASPIAVIETAGRSKTRSVVLRTGESFEGFELIEVRLHGVTLEKDGVRVDLLRDLPGA